jgi:hypothetical protein
MGEIYDPNKWKQWTLPYPNRADFPANLWGAIVYGICYAGAYITQCWHATVWHMFGPAYIQIQNMTSKENIDWARGLFSEVTDTPNIQPALREVARIASTTDPAMIVILNFALMLSSLTGMVGAVMSALTRPVINRVTAKVRGNHLDPASLSQAAFRGTLTTTDALQEMREAGLSDRDIAAVIDLNKQRLSSGDWIAAMMRGVVPQVQVAEELKRRGMPEADIAATLALARQLLDGQTIAASMFRGLITRSEALAKLKQLGLNDQDADALLTCQELIPGPSDLISMAVREAWNDAVASQWSYDEEYPELVGQWLSKTGMAEDWARRYWRAHWQLPSPDQAAEMVHRGLIDIETMRTLLKIADYPAYWRDKLIGITYAPLTRVDTRRMYGLGVLTRDQVKDSYRKLGYDETNAEYLTEFTVRYEEDDGSSKLEAQKKQTQNAIIASFKKGILTRAEAQTKLMDLELTNDEIEFILSMAEWELLNSRTPDVMEEYRDDMRKLLQRAYANHVYDRETIIQAYTELGMTESEAEYTLEAYDFLNQLEQLEQAQDSIGKAYVEGAISRTDAVSALGSLNIAGTQQNSLLNLWDASRILPTRRLTEAQYRAAVLLGAMTVDEYKDAMVDLGYSTQDIVYLVAILESKMPTEE